MPGLKGPRRWVQLIKTSCGVHVRQRGERAGTAGVSSHGVPKTVTVPNSIVLFMETGQSGKLDKDAEQAREEVSPWQMAQGRAREGGQIGSALSSRLPGYHRDSLSLLHHEQRLRPRAHRSGHEATAERLICLTNLPSVTSSQKAPYKAPTASSPPAHAVRVLAVLRMKQQG